MILTIVLGGIAAISIIFGMIRFIKAQKYKIRTAAGIQKTDYVVLGGIEQYIQIRGEDRSNPIIIMLHGGPGNAMAFYSYYWQAELEKAYTIINWDQRGCANTYYRNTEADKPALELLLSDLDELVDYACRAFGKDKVVIMGHSWGTFLGVAYVSKHPEKVAAYVGVGQFHDVWKSEQHAVDEAIRLANLAGKNQDAEKIKKQLQIVHTSQEADLQEFMKLRQLTGKYLPSGENTPFVVELFSPYLSFNDFKWFLTLLFNFKKFIHIQEELYKTLFSKEELPEHNITTFEVPVLIIAGDCDWIKPYEMAHAYFKQISAPKKKFILIEKVGHIPFKPGHFTQLVMKSLDELK